MTHWYSKSLGDGMWAPTARAEIENLFEPVFVSEGMPSDMAVFLREEQGGLHCEWIAYFSPAAQRVAERIGAAPCAPPMRAGLELLAGNESCWSALFPE
ncbi:MAG: hypothetical protein HFACDABA_01410 [Anaerolineales bacterium]|nr:hypothetical protein [Anaerolineales bacterium]